jgi:GcrA cell cycle regulator
VVKKDSGCKSRIGVKMNWTDERVEMLRKLWSEGLSASQIAAQLGNVTRNAVIGKVHRLKLSGRGKTTSSAPRVKKATTASAPRSSAPRSSSRISHGHTVGNAALKMDYVSVVRSQPMAEVMPLLVVPVSRELKLVQLTETTCKWPNGDPMQDDFSFCGSEAPDASPYCTYHSRLAYQPAAERKRMR